MDAMASMAYGDRVDEELPAEADGPFQVVGMPAELKRRIREAAHTERVSMSRYVIQLLGDMVPTIEGNDGRSAT